jgi:hypothetical protein
LIGVLEIGRSLVFVIVKRCRNCVCDGLQIIVGIKAARSRKMGIAQNTKPAVMYDHHCPLNLHQVSRENNRPDKYRVCLNSAHANEKVFH